MDAAHGSEHAHPAADAAPTAAVTEAVAAAEAAEQPKLEADPTSHLPANLQASPPRISEAPGAAVPAFVKAVDAVQAAPGASSDVTSHLGMEPPVRGEALDGAVTPATDLGSEDEADVGETASLLPQGGLPTTPGKAPLPHAAASTRRETLLQSLGGLLAPLAGVDKKPEEKEEAGAKEREKELAAAKEHTERLQARCPAPGGRASRSCADGHALIRRGMLDTRRSH